MRSFASVVLTLVAIVASIAALPALWTQERVVDRDGFTAFAASMAREPSIQQPIADEVARQIADRTSVVSATLIRPATEAYTRSDQFPADFAEVLGQQHDYLFTAPTTEAERSGVLELNLAPMVRRVVAGLGLPTSNIDTSIEVPVDESSRSGLEAGRYQQPSEQISRWALVATIVAVIAGLGAIAVARRRGLVIAALGVGLVISAVVAYVVGDTVRGRAMDEVSGATSSPRQVAQEIIDLAVDDFHHTALIVGGSGVAILAIGVLVSLVFERRVRR